MCLSIVNFKKNIKKKTTVRVHVFSSVLGGQSKLHVSIFVQLYLFPTVATKP